MTKKLKILLSSVSAFPLVVMSAACKNGEEENEKNEGENNKTESKRAEETKKAKESFSKASDSTIAYINENVSVAVGKKVQEKLNKYKNEANLGKITFDELTNITKDIESVVKGFPRALSHLDMFLEMMKLRDKEDKKVNYDELEEELDKNLYRAYQIDKFVFTLLNFIENDIPWDSKDQAEIKKAIVAEKDIELKKDLLRFAQYFRKYEKEIINPNEEKQKEAVENLKWVVSKQPYFAVDFSKVDNDEKYKSFKTLKYLFVACEMIHQSSDGGKKFNHEDYEFAKGLKNIFSFLELIKDISILCYEKNQELTKEVSLEKFAKDTPKHNLAKAYKEENKALFLKMIHKFVLTNEEIETFTDSDADAFTDFIKKI